MFTWSGKKSAKYYNYYIDFYITNLILFYIYGIINKHFGAKTLKGITFFEYILKTSVNDAPCEHRELIACVIRLETLLALRSAVATF